MGSLGAQRTALKDHIVDKGCMQQSSRNVAKGFQRDRGAEEVTSSCRVTLQELC